MPKVAKTLMGIFAEDVAWDKEEEKARKAAQEQVVKREPHASTYAPQGTHARSPRSSYSHTRCCVFELLRPLNNAAGIDNDCDLNLSLPGPGCKCKTSTELSRADGNHTNPIVCCLHGSAFLCV